MTVGRRTAVEGPSIHSSSRVRSSTGAPSPDGRATRICLACEGISTTEQDLCGSCGIPLVTTAAVHFPLRRGESDAANPLLGTLLDGKYRIVGVLGRGGMGTVYRALHAVSLMPLAVKLLHPRHGSRPDYRRAFVQEARKAGRVVHDHCARVLDVVETEDGTAYLAMELAEGDTLDEWTRGGRGVAPAAAVAILRQICLALIAIHKAGLVHRDLSARNVMMSVRDGAPMVKVLDFGIAKAAAMVAREGAPDPVAEVVGLANPVFSAPEHLAGGPVDARADLYSLGAIGFLLLTGRLPVAAGDAREAARRTMAGELEPLPAVAGVPRRLHRLLRRCLQREPLRRPASAAVVLAELDAVAGLGRRRAQAGVMALGLAGVVTAALLFAGRTAYLRPVGSALEGFGVTLPRSAPVRHVRSADLDTLRFHFGGFAPDRLHVEVSRDGVPLLTPRLDPVRDRDPGRLILSTAQAGWRAALQGIAQACAGGPVDLQFVVPGQPPLGGLRVLVDDQPPQVEWALLEATSGPLVLRGGSRLRYRVGDAGGLDTAQVRVAFGSGREVVVPLPPDGQVLELGAELARRLPGFLDLGAGTLAIGARDRAGNVDTGQEPLPFVACDLAAPAVLGVAGPVGEPHVEWSGPTARLRLRLEGFEPGMSVAVVGPEGAALELRELRPTGTADWLQATLASDGDPAVAFVSGLHTFTVRDEAGNRTERTLPLQFRGVRLDPTWTAGAGAVTLGRELVVGPDGAPLEFACNPAFRVEQAQVRRSAGPPLPLSVTASGPGRVQLAVPALEPGEHRLELRLLDGVGGLAVTEALPLRALPARLEIRLPAVAGPYLPQLLDAGLLQRAPDGLREGAGWRTDPAWRRLLRGHLWIGGADLTPVPLGEPGQGFLLPPITPVNGRNLLALELVDVLGRPVAILVGNEPAGTVRHGGQDLAVLADFQHHTDPPVVVGEEVRVEFGQPARLQVRSPLPFRAEDRPAIRLGLAQAEVLPSVLEPAPGGGTLLTFHVPATVWAAAANLAELGRDDYARNLLRPASAHLVTPDVAADAAPELVLNLRTSRSTLVPIALGDLPRPAPLAAGLAGITLVPVLAPDGVFVDPVGLELPARGLFRPLRDLSVRGIVDYYLQDRELTRAQYAAAVVAFLQLPPERRPEPAVLVHADDPLGPARLGLEGMRPQVWGAAAWPACGPDDGEAAVTGVQWFQAYTVTRLIGVLLDGDPGLLRLPLGCELDRAALGTGSVALPGGAGGVAQAAWAEPRDPGRAPAAGELRARGDRVATAAGGEILGLDFGVREWVFDVAEGGAQGSAALLHEWTGDHGLHLAKVTAFAAGAAPPRDVGGRLRELAVVRGLAFGEAFGLVSGLTGRPVIPAAGDVLPADVPGVVRIEQMRRDGRDLVGAGSDPRLARVGLRLAGGAALAQRVRGR